jgi:hypothetical protein
MHLRFAWLRRSSGGHPRAGRGQGLVEFALVLPILAIMLLMAIDLGRLFFGWVAVQNMARIGASYAASYPSATWGAGSTYQDALDADASTINCDRPTTWPAPVFINGGGTQIGDEVQVSLTCAFHPLTPLISAFTGDPINLGASVVYQIKAGIIGGVPVGTAVPTASPSPSPSASVGPCTVPTFIGMHVNSAPSAWASANFVPSNLTVSLGTGNYKITTETPSSADGTQQDCATFKLTVGP